MTEKKKRSILPAALGASAVSAGLIAVALLLADSAYRDIGAGLLSVAAAAFIADFFILLLLRRRTVPSGIIKGIALLLVNSVLFVSAGIYWFGPVAIFHPNADAAAEETLSVTPGVRYLEENDGALCGWRYACGLSDAPVILCFYGNGETASRKMVEFLSYISQGYFTGFDIAVFDYPGYGHAPGRPTEASVTAMGLSAYDYLKQSGDSVCVYGYSVGTGPATCVAANREILSLVLMAPYADGYDLFNNFIPVFHSVPMKALVSFKMENCKLAERVTVTPLILATEHDRTIPFASSERLASCFADAIFRKVDVSDHWTFWSNAECLRLSSDHFREAVS